LARASQTWLGIASVATLAMLFVVPVILAHQTTRPVRPVTKLPSPKDIVADIPNATLVGREEGKRVWRMKAERVQASRDGRTTTFINVSDGILYRNEVAIATFRAGRAVYDNVEKSLNADRVVTIRSGDLIIKTNRLSWKKSDSVLRVSGVTNLAWNGGAASAESVEYNTRTKSITGKRAKMTARLDAPATKSLARRAGAPDETIAVFLSEPAKEPTPPNYREVRFLNADVWKYDEPAETYHFKGNVKIAQGDTAFSADSVVYRKDPNTATITGNITVEAGEVKARGDSADVDFDDKVVRLKGANGVSIVLMPGASSKQAQGVRSKIKDPVSITCPQVSYYYKEKRAEVTGPLKMTRKDQVLTGDWATYRGADETLQITGNVKGRDEQNQTFETPSLKVFLKEGAEGLEATFFSGTFRVKDEDETKSGEKAPDSPPAAR